MTLEKHLTIKQVAIQLQLSERTIRRWIKNGRLKAASFPGRYGVEYRIPLSSLRGLNFGVEDIEENGTEVKG